MPADSRCTAPRSDERHGSATYKGRNVEVDVLQDSEYAGSHIVIVIQGGTRPQTVEYITDHAEVGLAMTAGFEIARAVIDERRI